MPLNSRCYRIMLIGFNLLFWLSGLQMLSTGIILLGCYGIIHACRVVTAEVETAADGIEKAVYMTPDGMKHVGCALIALGGITLIAAMLGCRPAITGNKRMMVSLSWPYVLIGHGVWGWPKLEPRIQRALYFSILSLILCAEVGVMALTLSTRETVLDGLEHRMVRTFKTILAQDATYDNTFNFVQKSGCLKFLEDYFKKAIHILLSIELAVIGVMVYGLLTSYCLCQERQEGHRDVPLTVI